MEGSMGIVAPPGLSDAAHSELLAMLEVMYLVATSDGFFSIPERAEFLKSVESLSEGKIGGTELSELVEVWVSRGSTAELPVRLNRLAQELPDLISRRIAYGLAVQIAEVDGQFLESEAKMLGRVAQAFELEEGAPEEITQSVRMSRGPRLPEH